MSLCYSVLKFPAVLAALNYVLGLFSKYTDIIWLALRLSATLLKLSLGRKPGNWSLSHVFPFPYESPPCAPYFPVLESWSEEFIHTSVLFYSHLWWKVQVGTVSMRLEVDSCELQIILSVHIVLSTESFILLQAQWFFCVFFFPGTGTRTYNLMLTGRCLCLQS